MKTKFFAVLMLILCSFVFANAQAPQPQTELAKYIQDNYTKREVMIPIRDGVKLFTSVDKPKDKSVKYPILLNRTPYTVAPYGVTPDKFLG